MYCKNCGKEIDDKAAICVYCGVPTSAYVRLDGQADIPEQNNVMAIVGFVLSFFVAVAGLICSIIGYRNVPKYGGKGRGFALAGIIISIVSIIGTVIYICIALSFLFSAMPGGGL